MRSITTRCHGFTLVEAVAVIVITGIIAGVVAMFIARPVEGYVDAARRVMLTDMADNALRRMGRDIRLAVPNSVRVSGVNAFLEFIPTADGVRYRVDTVSGVATNTLDFSSAADTSFDIFGVSAVAAGNGSHMVIFNTGQCGGACNSACSLSGGADAYQGCNRRTVTAATAVGVSFTNTAFPLPFDSPSHRVNFVPATGPVTYACQSVGMDANGTGTGTLTRYTGYATGAGIWDAGGQPVSAPTGGTSTQLADNISQCVFNYQPGATQRSGLVTLRLSISRSHETVTLYHEVHVDNQP